jgi:hypothetical protein
MQALNATTIVLAVLAPLLIWRLYIRFRRMIGRQRLSRVRPWITLIMFPTIVILLTYAAHWDLERLLWLAGGLVFGSFLGVYGFRQTRFESTPQGLFYTPHAHLGIALSLLLVGRLLYRLVEVYGLDTAAPRGAPQFAQSALTLAIFGLLAGYYIVYALGLVRWQNHAGRDEERESKATDA